ncbi:MAG: tryptophan--tRNA ligase [Alphaproteobacteria bacterium]|jgi:tryptophanyl-tRNA synthetase
MARIFSGIQPTNHLTIGNYLGAMKNWVDMQNDYESLFCIVDLHAITVTQNPKELASNCLTNLALYIASGLDPEKCILFIQSAVPEHTELAWIFSTITPLGWLNRMTQFKDKAGKNRENAGLGLYAYPVLMAADILLYHATHVPVGEDQKQHLELARDIAGAFNRGFATDFFKAPDVIIPKEAGRIMSLRDGTKKMSKSNSSDFTRINMTDDADLIMQKIKKATTDSIEGIYYDYENRPEVSNLLTIYAAFANCSIDDAAKHFNSYQSSKFKQELADVIIGGLAPIQKKSNDLLSDKGELMRVANVGASKAREIAAQTILDVKKLVGLYV